MAALTGKSDMTDMSFQFDIHVVTIGDFFNTMTQQVCFEEMQDKMVSSEQICTGQSQTLANNDKLICRMSQRHRGFTASVGEYTSSFTWLMHH